MYDGELPGTGGAGALDLGAMLYSTDGLLKLCP
jgi:hypothetical protein